VHGWRGWLIRHRVTVAGYRQQRRIALSYKTDGQYL